MEPQTVDFKPAAPKMSEGLQAAIAKTEAALKQRWAREEQEAQTVYEITIPTQTLTICGKDRAELVLRTLKSLKLAGTYRVTKK